MTLCWIFALSTITVVSACKSKVMLTILVKNMKMGVQVAEVEGPIPFETPVEEFTFSMKKMGDFTFRSLSFCPFM